MTGTINEDTDDQIAVSRFDDVRSDSQDLSQMHALRDVTGLFDQSDAN